MTIEPPEGRKSFDSPYIYITFVNLDEEDILALKVEATFPVDLEMQLALRLQDDGTPAYIPKTLCEIEQEAEENFQRIVQSNPQIQRVAKEL